MMAISDEIRSLILKRSPNHEIRRVATQEGMRSLREDGWRIVREGRTTIDELMQNTKDEEHQLRFSTTAEVAG
jgi:type II secretory ATPase GspE/PulE/Tfp pilus assembly ATPase PilB-like protein